MSHSEEARMTLAVYRFDPMTGERRNIKAVTVEVRDTVTPDTSPGFPPCSCQKCREGREAGH